MGARIVLITGGTKGIGAAAAEEFARTGDVVAICGSSDRDSLNRTLARLRRIQKQSTGRIVDVRRSSAVNSWVDSIIERFGRIDVAISNAGIIRPSPFLQITEKQWDEVVETHLKGTFLVFQAVARTMIEKHVAGSLIAVSAPSGIRGAEGVADYASAKGGIISLTKCLAKELGRHGIRVNSVSPAAYTGMTEKLMAFRGVDLSTWEKRYLGGKAPPARGTAGTFLFLASDAARYITGQVVSVDDGASL